MATIVINGEDFDMSDPSIFNFTNQQTDDVIWEAGTTTTTWKGGSYTSWTTPDVKTDITNDTSHYAWTTDSGYYIQATGINLDYTHNPPTSGYVNSITIFSQEGTEITITDFGWVAITDLLSGQDLFDTLFSGDDTFAADIASNDIIYAGDGDDTFTTNAYDPSIFYGEDGNDTMTADFDKNIGKGSDEMYGGDGDDIVISTGGVSSSGYADGGNGNDTFVIDETTGYSINLENAEVTHSKYYGLEDEDIPSDATLQIISFENATGGDGNDIITGSSDDNTLKGMGGDDEIYGEFGDDQLAGGDGSDSLDGGKGDDVITGDDGNDELLGGLGDDIMDGGSHADSLEGGAGGDTMSGGSGNDDFIFRDGEGSGSGARGSTADSIDGGTGTDTLLVTSTSSSEDFDFKTLNVTSIEQIEFDSTPTQGSKSLSFYSDAFSYGGGEFANDLKIIGTASKSSTEEINIYMQSTTGTKGIKTSEDLDLREWTFKNWGETGQNDLISITGSQAGDDIISTRKDDYIEAGDGADTIDARAGNDEVYGGDGNDVIYGRDGNDDLSGDAGDDEIYGGDGEDVLTGASGGDYLDGGNDNDDLDGGDDNDEIYGGDGEDVLTGASGDDYLDGGNDNDDLDGGSGDDEIYGGDGTDTINGGKGDDSMTGGSGADTFLFNTGFGEDRIEDFEDGVDIIDVSGLGLSASDLVVKNGTYRAVVSFGGDDSIIIADMANNIDASDFIF